MSPYKNRIPVVYRNKPLMPMTWKRAKKYCKLGFGRIRSTKDRLIYLQLLKEPSGFNIQPIVLGIDPGSMFDGFTVLSNKEHLLNIELIHTKDIKKRMEKKGFYRRIRRGRLWHRPARFDNRTSKKIPPTIRSKVEFRVNTILNLLKLFPISIVNIEDVKYNHYKETKDILHKRGKSFSPVEVSKNYLYDTVRSLEIELNTYKGWQTKEARIRFCNGNDPKKKNKADRSFFAHCIDSLILANFSLDFEKYKKDTNFNIMFIQRDFIVRRELHREKNKIGDKRRYFKYSKGGEKVYFEKMTKLKKLRIKPDDSRSYHGPWKYKYSESIECFKKFRTNYGGTKILGTGGNKWNKEDMGESKRFIRGNKCEYRNRIISLS